MGLRPEQEHIAEYAGGRAAVSAVPGSGKTYTLAALAARLLVSGRVADDAEILVVTFTNSAVDNIRTRIHKSLIEHSGFDAGGYRVLTLHGLAHMIVRERPDLAGTTSDFRVDDELSGRQTMPEATRTFINQASDYWRSFLSPDLTAPQRAQAEEKWREATQNLGEEVTRMAKNLRYTPQDMIRLIQRAGPEDEIRGAEADGSPINALSLLRSTTNPAISPFLLIGIAIYERYERILNLGGRLDFDDLIWRAIMALENDDGFRRSLGVRWPYILEDEAQDSTPLQEQILSMLSREHNNWLRVGDPNQAIMTTFTASDVRFFRDFLRRPEVKPYPLSVSGRSAPQIIDMANRLADWAVLRHPEPEVRAAALANVVRIRPTQPGDAQQNPPESEGRVYVQRFDADETEVQKVALSAEKYVLARPGRTCAILTPTNYFGRQIVDELESQQQKNHPQKMLYQDQLRNPQGVRDVAELLAGAVRVCSVPTNANALADVNKRLHDSRVGSASGVSEPRMRTLLRSAHPERLFFPSPAAEPAIPASVPVSEEEQQALLDLSARVSKWLRASFLPVDQLVLTIAQDMLTRENDLAIAHSLALSLRRLAAVNPQMQLLDLARELEEIAANRQKFMSNALIETGFEPEPGMITVTTMHKAKGLEWDRVYLTSVDQVEFPHDCEGVFRGEQWYLGGHDPATEARMQLEALANGLVPLPGDAELVRRARVEYIAERLRLLYVGITRAKRELIVSYSRTRRSRENELALAIQEITSE
ncbi:MAG TPA: ATP-dependent helicase [Anaerolineae bacterium]